MKRLALGVVLASLAALGRAQGSAPATPIASPMDDPVATRATSLSGIFSINELLDFFKSFGVNFVVPANLDLDGVKVRVNIQDRPIRDVMFGVAATLSGSWVYQSGIYVLRVPTGQLPKLPTSTAPKPIVALPSAVDATAPGTLPPAGTAAKIPVKPPTPASKKPVAKKPTTRKTSSKTSSRSRRKRT